MNGKYFNPARSKKLFQLVFLAFFLILFAAVGNALLDKNEKSGEVILVLDFGDNKKTYQTFLSEEKKAGGLLQQVAAISGITLEVNANLVLNKIDGKENGEDDKNWNFYVNGEKKEGSPYDVVVKAPVKVEFKFE